MKQVIKNSMATVALGAVTLSAACTNSNGAKTYAGHEHHKHSGSDHAGEHTYACPMHPEVTGKKGDNCPKCNMELEHIENAENSKGFFMQFSTSPATVNAKQEVSLSFIPKVKDNPQEEVALEIEHEKKIHLILVNDDLSWFDHIHPEFNNDGSYTVKEKFPAPGSYTLFADYKPSGGGHMVDKLNLVVPGTTSSSKIYDANKLNGVSDNFTVTLNPTGGKLITGAMMHIAGTLLKDGKEINPNTLEDYLGAKAHMVVVGISDKEYLHVHPGVTDGKFALHTTFEKPGIYRGWIQFQSEGKLHTVDFTIDVKEGTANEITMMNHAAGDAHKTGMDHNH